MQLAPKPAASVAPQKLRRGPVSRGQQKRSGSGITTADNTPTVPPLPLTPLPLTLQPFSGEDVVSGVVPARNAINPPRS